MKLRDCVMGILVQDKETKAIGMIVGITNSLDGFLTEEQKDPSRAIQKLSGSQVGLQVSTT
ncbi:hypothetical protein NVP1170O_078 [Vibrio phage 1.170.O._10N.261.52.C3]|nr:hypothetical protein NVP1170O_078 [Vibrio phage 1.170.O._10N.261.52.C3]